MADHSISIHGAHRAKHLLVVTLAVALISGCAESDPAAVRLDAESAIPDWRALLDENLTRAEPLQPIVFPADLASHPEASAESFSVRGVLVDQSDALISVSAQIDRIRLRNESAQRSSEWDYSSVFRAQAALGKEAMTISPSQELIARGALGLASSELGSIRVGLNTLRMETTVATDNPCLARLSFTNRLPADQLLQFSSELSDCPVAASVGDLLNQWEVSAVALTGDLQGQPVTGVVWISHTWGELPQPGGAILLDQLRLKLDTDEGEAILINANRTKRRSGRGPVTVLASRLTVEGESEALELDWIDKGSITSETTGINYAETYRVTQAGLNLDLQLQPVVPMSEIVDAFGTRWSGAVKISGSHTGIGFVDISPNVPGKSKD